MSNNKLAEAIEYVEANHPLPRCSHGGALRDHSGEALEPPCGCRVPEAEVPPQRIRCHTSPVLALYKVKDDHRCDDCIEYVPASALAEVWDQAIRTQCQYCAEGDKPVWDDQVAYAYHHEGLVGCAASKLIEARDAALSVQKENKDEG